MAPYCHNDMNKGNFTILENTPLGKGCFRLVLQAPEECKAEFIPGQFVQISLEGFFLRRPISVCDFEDGRLTLLVKKTGAGTEALSGLKEGDSLNLLYPLGNGFDCSAATSSALLIGGGIGAAPLLYLGKALLGRGVKPTVVLGFNSACEAVLLEDFRSLGVDLHIATMDGTLGTKGFVTDAVREHSLKAGYFYCCGPTPMMKAVRAALGTDGEFSLEERMGCGAGFCYGCSIQTARGPKRVCEDGPVFKKEDLLWN